MTTAFQHRRERDVNFGDRTKLTGGEQKTLASMSIAESASFTVYASAKVTAPAALAPYIVPLALVEWGHGGASVGAEYRIVNRLRVPLAASMIQVAGKLIDVRTGGPAPDSASVEVSAFIARGTDGETIHNAASVSQHGASGLLVGGPQQVLAARGYNAGSSDLWVMLFDDVAAPSAATAPTLALPAPRAPATFACEPKSPRAFVAGVWWAASASPFNLVPAPSASLYLEVELLQ